MRNFLIIFICMLVPASFYAQEFSQNLESFQITTIGEKIIISGYKPLSKGQVFKAYMCDKNLVLLNEYTKTLPSTTSSFYTGKNGGFFVFSFYGNGQKEKYRIALDTNFMEKYAAEPESDKNQVVDENTTTVTDWNYDGSYCNDYIIGDLLIDAQMDAITCYSLSDPIKGTYKKKWEKGFDGKEIYVKMEILGIQDRTAYILAVESIPQSLQKFLAINIDDGTVLFTTELNTADSLDAVSVSSFLVKGDIIYLGGTYILTEPDESFVPTFISVSDNQTRGYDNIAPYILAPADGYFLMTLNSKGGEIIKMKTFEFPDIDKTVDNRDFRMAICHGISPLSNGKMVAFFELISSAYKAGMAVGSRFGGVLGGSSEISIDSDNTPPNQVLWETDAFTSVVFNADMSDFSSTLLKWEEESSDYDLYDYDLFSLSPKQEIPHDFCTVNDDGCYPQNFVCDGTNWVYHIHSDEDKQIDFLIRCNESEMKPLKLLPPGILLLTETTKGLQLKDMGGTIKLKIYSFN